MNARLGDVTTMYCVMAAWLCAVFGRCWPARCRPHQMSWGTGLGPDLAFEQNCAPVMQNLANCKHFRKELFVDRLWFEKLHLLVGKNKPHQADLGYAWEITMSPFKLHSSYHSIEVWKHVLWKVLPISCGGQMPLWGFCMTKAYGYCTTKRLTLKDEERVRELFHSPH